MSQSSSTSRKAKVCATEVSEEKEDIPPSYKLSVSDIHAMIHTMTCKKREQLLEKLIEEGSNKEDAKSQADEKDF
jgi:hypothetical protein